MVKFSEGVNNAEIFLKVLIMQKLTSLNLSHGGKLLILKSPVFLGRLHRTPPAV
uniref:Uncharacterized protein n=1 Tax=Arundo donax TaxID=35708 RepID=A0A0A9EEZ8_ARUDO